MEPNGNGTQNKVSEVAAKVQPKKKPVKQPGDKPGYNPGGEKAFVTADVIKRNMTYNHLFFDQEVPIAIGGAMSSFTFPTHCKVDPENHVDRNVWNGLCYQLVTLLFFKQLAASMQTDLHYVEAHFGRLVGQSILVPSGLLPIVKQYGTVTAPNGNWEMVGQAIHATTMLLRGIGNPVETYAGIAQAVNRVESVGFDASMPNGWAFLIDWARGVINQWCYGKSLTVQNGALQAHIESPVLRDGFETFFAVFQATAFPIEVIRAFRIGNIAEGALRMVPVPQGGNVPVGIVNALNVERVIVYSWRREEADARFAAYYDQVQHVVRGTLDEVFVMVEATQMMKMGEVSQLSSRVSPENVLVHEKIPGDQAEMGAMLSTTKSGADLRNPTFRIESQGTPSAMIVTWLNGMNKGKKKANQ